ncbi:Photosystem I assembly protein Ycf3 [Vibrio stylophorae]|uniref:Photosystem I assembly protein Ycf3 n=1 Tax=Vibrio stylophorae TaxID=659351 RepID=A0ABN8DVJ8_9VIBR|nr:tetratricopeptide repeat protein [Vibrio stylophorae]CAH0533940.1 Photosystem I assembly protein Ycf3 [Vibrio stylophorae]
MTHSIRISAWCAGLLLLLSGCAQTQTSNDPVLNSEYYDGDPMLNLMGDTPPANEQEAQGRGMQALLDGNLDLALYEYIRAVQFLDATEQADSFYQIGSIHQIRDNTDLAERAFRQSLAYDPKYIASLEKLGILESKRGKTAQGAQYFLEALSADQHRLGENPNTSLTRNMPVSTIRNLKFDAQSPIGSYIGLGVISDIDRDHDRAKAYLEHALEINPNSVRALVNLGYSNYMDGNYELAAHLTQAALRLQPSHAKALNNMALIYLAQNRPGLALSTFQRHMTEAEALNNVGYFLLIQGKPDQAVPYLQQAISADPAYYKTAHDNLERALAEMRAQGSGS